jgi:hypothetical protein
MAEFYNKNYYIDIDGMIDKCRTGKTLEDEDGKEVMEINVFKYELLKMMIDRVLNEIDDIEEDDVLSSLKQSSGSVSFNLAFNTLIQYGIINEET